MSLGNLWHRATHYKYFSRRKHREEWRAIATAAWNARLSATRSTQDSRGVNITSLDASPQLDSLFFRKLPLEIRRQIYFDVLAGNQLLFRVINEDTSLNGHEIGKEKIPFELTCDAARGLLSFPVSCKLAYIESLDYLYTGNTFRLAGITEYSCLKRVVPQHSLDLIQNLHLQWSYEAFENERSTEVGVPPYHIDWWNETWLAISRWKGLAHVRVDIHRYETNIRRCTYDEEHFFSALNALGDHIELEVRVSWMEYDSVLPNADDWPFLIKRNMKYHEDDNGTFRLGAR